MRNSDDSFFNNSEIDVLVIFTHSNQNIILILSKPTRQRTNENLEQCYEYLKKMKFFAQLSMEMSKDQIKNIIRELSFEKFQSRQIIFAIGDMGRKFYIVLQGSVAIMKPLEIKQDEKQDSGKEFAKKLKNDNKRLFAHYFQDDLDENDFFEQEGYLQEENLFIDEHRRQLKQKYKSFQICKELGEGDSFGEVALRTEGLRTASAITMEETYLLYLSVGAYYNVLKSYHDGLYNDKLNFLKNIRIFKNWTLSAIHQLLYYMKTYTGHRGDVIYRQNEPAKYLYFIRHGEVEMIQYIEQPFLIEPEENQLILNEIKRNVHKTKYRKSVEQKLCTLGENQLFGDKEIFLKTNRQTEVRVRSSNCEIYYISKKIFFNQLATFLHIRDMYKNHQIQKVWHDQILDNNLQSKQQIDEQKSPLKLKPVVYDKKYYVSQRFKTQLEQSINIENEKNIRQRLQKKMKTEVSFKNQQSLNLSLKDLLNNRTRELVGKYRTPLKNNFDCEALNISKGIEGNQLARNDSSMFFTTNKQIEEVHHEFEEEIVDDEYLKEKFPIIQNETKDTKDTKDTTEQKPEKLQKHISCITLYTVGKQGSSIELRNKQQKKSPVKKIILPFLQQIKKGRQKRTMYNNMIVKRSLKIVP